MLLLVKRGLNMFRVWIVSMAAVPLYYRLHYRILKCIYIHILRINT